MHNGDSPLIRSKQSALQLMYLYNHPQIEEAGPSANVLALLSLTPESSEQMQGPVLNLQLEILASEISMDQFTKQQFGNWRCKSKLFANFCRGA